jgi:dGTPase
MNSNPQTLEGRAVSIADRIAYINHDIDDAISSGFISEKDLPKKAVKVLGKRSSERINAMIYSIYKASDGKNVVTMDEEVAEATALLRTFMFERVYNDKKIFNEEEKADRMISSLYEYFKKHADKMPRFYVSLLDKFDVDTVICDYISGMSDGFVTETFKSMFIPAKWEIQPNERL